LGEPLPPLSASLQRLFSLPGSGADGLGLPGIKATRVCPGGAVLDDPPLTVSSGGDAVVAGYRYPTPGGRIVAAPDMAQISADADDIDVLIGEARAQLK
jgi:hypothetical protein